MKPLGIKIRLPVLFILSFMVRGCFIPNHASYDATYVNPSWAPSYYEGTRYYYPPDLEVYYDLPNQEFIYLDNGMWIFATTLPPVYGYYDLNNGFVVALNWRVYQPWLYHQYYLFHYPRYYYRHYYPKSKTPVRGFNENDRRPIKVISPDKRISIPRNPGRIRIPNQPENIQRKTPVNKSPQPSIFRGRDIGRPVKVKSDMRERKGK
ncbi:MAG: hypothetical protein EPN37_09230 [Chitinophagaceae bacterium]|nr:MAG: hypothetical protein EPN37_09230 [Chitinophagaceae bacterium]